MPLLRAPIQASYIFYAHTVNPRLAWTYLQASITALRATRTAPSLLSHPLELLDASEAPGLQFFPGMNVPAATKIRVLDRVDSQMSRHWHLGSTLEHAREAGRHSMAVLPTAGAGGHAPWCSSFACCSAMSLIMPSSRRALGSCSARVRTGVVR